MAEPELYHYGIKGQRWGVRRSVSKLASVRGHSSEDPLNEDYSRAHTSKGVKTLGDKELRDRINRLQMERQYKLLTASELSAGGKFVQDVLVNAAKQTATSYVAKGMGKGVDTLISSLLKKKSG